MVCPTGRMTGEQVHSVNLAPKLLPMKRPLLIAVLSLLMVSAHAQPAADYAVRVSAEVQTSPATITLRWVQDANATSHSIYRKLVTGTSWGSAMSTLPGSASNFVDTTVVLGESYEYRVVKSAGSYTGYGYTNSGIEVPAMEYRGKLLLVVDTTYAASLAVVLNRLEKDMSGDGWEVIRLDVDRADLVPDVKARIVAEYNADPTTVKTVFLFGHVPVPYSGNIAPDGHVPDHQGAWPADNYYGDMNGNWTDASVNVTAATDPRNDNIPGDGKFDQSFIPSDIELEVGRVDMANLPAFAANEEQLLRRYLEKDHMFRHKQFDVTRRALIDDNFGGFGGEAFSATGWKNFTAMFDSTNVVELDYRSTMSADSYMWSYGCGAGSHTSCNGIGNTTDLSGDSLQSVFTILFGSYFGDWDRSNNFLSAALAQGQTLTNCWAGRPHWAFHHMALGSNIGYSTRVSQNNSGNMYFGNYGMRFVHVALLGDPTLRMHIVAPPANLVASANGNHVDLSWTASTDSVMGYYIYRKDSANGFTRVSPQPVNATTFIDSCVIGPADYTYMLRAVKLEQSASGTYYNLSQGICDTVSAVNDFTVIAGFTPTVWGDSVSITNQCINASGYSWDFGDSSISAAIQPSHVYVSDNTYNIILIAYNECHADTLAMPVLINTVGQEQLVQKPILNVFPNPTTGLISIQLSGVATGLMRLEDLTGRLIYSGPQRAVIDLSDLPTGVYLLKAGGITRKVIVAR